MSKSNIFLSLFIFAISLLMLSFPNINLVGDIAIWFSYIKGMDLQNITLYKDVYEINFPGVFIFQYLPYQLYKITGFNSYNWFFILEAILLTYFIGYLVYKIENSIKLGLLFVFISLIVHFGMFGQRDYFVILLIFPYILSKLKILNSDELDSSKIRYISIILFALAIYIKPIYALLYVLIEIYILIRKKKIYSFIEWFIMFIMGVIYILSIYIYLPYFFTNIIYDFSFYLEYFNYKLPLIYYPKALMAIPLILLILIYLKKYNELFIFLSFNIVLVIQTHFFEYYLIPIFVYSLYILIRSKCYISSLFIGWFSLYSLFALLNLNISMNNLEKTYLENIDINKSFYIIDNISRSSNFLLNYSNILDIGSSGTLSLNVAEKFRNTEFYIDKKDRILNSIKKNNIEQLIVFDKKINEKMKKWLLVNYNLSKKFKYNNHDVNIYIINKGDK